MELKEAKELIEELQYLNTEVVKNVKELNNELGEKIGTGELVVVKLENIINRLQTLENPKKNKSIEIEELREDINKLKKYNLVFFAANLILLVIIIYFSI